MGCLLGHTRPTAMHRTPAPIPTSLTIRVLPASPPRPGGWPGQSRSFNSRGCPVQAPLGRGSPPLNEDVVVTHLFLAPGSNSGTAPPFVHFLLEPGPSMMIISHCRYYL